MNNGHTPEPWKKSYNEDGSHTIVQPRAGFDLVLAVIKQPDNGSDLANGYLMAAAPALLRLLQDVLLRLDLEAEEQGPDAAFPCAAMRSDIRAAIKEATA